MRPSAGEEICRDGCAPTDAGDGERVKRWNLVIRGLVANMEEHENGQWVRHESLAALQERERALTAALRDGVVITSSLNVTTMPLIDWRRRVAALTAETQ